MGDVPFYSRRTYSPLGSLPNKGVAMRRLIFGALVCCLLAGWAPQASAATKIVVLSFSESGKISAGAGDTLATLLASSLDARRYHIMDANRLQEVLKRHSWRKKRALTAAMLRDLSKLGVRLILTGAVSSHYKTFTVTYRAVSLQGRVLHSEVLPPVKDWSALVGSLKYSVRMLLRRSSRTSKKGKKKKAKKKGKKGKKKGKKKKKKKKKLKSFKKVVKGMKRSKGLFPLWIKKDQFGKYKIYMEIKPSQIDKIFLLSPTLEGGTGSYPLLPFAQLPEYPLSFRKRGKYLVVMEPNVRFRVNKKKALSRVMDRSFTDTVHGYAPILSAPHPKRKSILIDFKRLFQYQLAGLTYYVRVRMRYYQRTLRMHKTLSQIYLLKTFPKNVEVGFDAFFRRIGSSVTVPSGSMMRIKLRYSLSERPSTKYRPRLADDRVGHFLMIAKDYSDDRRDTRYIRYITRWHLEKKYPKKKLSVPKKPIVYWLDNGIPKRYRAAVSRGITIWNDAFREAGFKNAMVAKQQPANAKWDGADVRYNTIRWFMAHRAGFAQGPSRIDPLTGQIYDADIRVDADMALYLNSQFRMQVAPIRAMGGLGLRTLLEPLRQMTKLAKLESALKRLNHRPTFHDKHGHKHAAKRWRFCDYARGSMVQATLGWHLMEMRGMLPNPEMEKRFIDEFMVSLIAHEVGHTLGLRHNFKASTLHTITQLHDSKRTKKMGLTNSMMEYTPVNLAPTGKKQGQFWQTTLGPYDKWAIKYAYTPFPEAKTIAAERPMLNKIAKRVAEHKLAYATDEDAFGSVSPYSVDPTTLRWDLGREPLNFYKTRIAIANEMLAKVEKKFENPKSSYQKMRRVFNMSVGTYFRAGLQAAKYLGGIYHRRDHIGDPKGRLPFKPVPAAKQRAALQFLVKNFFGPGGFQWNAKLVNKLAPERLWDFEFSVWGARVDYPIHGINLFLQGLPLARAIHPAVLERIQDTRLRLPKKASYLSIHELFSTLTKAAWAEIYHTPKPTSKTTEGKKAQKRHPLVINSLRRNFQWYYIYWLGAYKSAPLFENTNASSVAYLQLLDLQKQIKKRLGDAKDPMTKAHLLKTLDKIKMIFKPTLIRFR